METPEQRFNRLVLENNLTLSIGELTTSRIESGSIIVNVPSLSVHFTDPTKENGEQTE